MKRSGLALCLLAIMILTWNQKGLIRVGAGQELAFLPILSNGILELSIFDKDGNKQDWDWLVENFGPITVDRSGRVNVVELREIEGPNTLVVDVGIPLEQVVFYWPDAPFLPVELQNCGRDRGLIVLSKETGMAEFSMGGGAYYFPPNVGPHWVWTKDSGCLGGIGMLGGTNHVHLDPTFR